MQKRLIEAVVTMPLDPGLILHEATFVEHEGRPILLVRFNDARRPDQRLGGWWDFHGYEQQVADPREAGWLASHAKIHLEDLFHAGGALLERPVDADGIRWGELDWAPGEAHRLPPHKRSGDS